MADKKQIAVILGLAEEALSDTARFLGCGWSPCLSCTLPICKSKSDQGKGQNTYATLGHSWAQENN